MTSAVSAKVFISYNRGSSQDGQRALELANRLRNDGIDARIDQYVPHPPEGWPRWIHNQVAECDFVVLICTTEFRRQYDREEPPNASNNSPGWEALLTESHVYEAGARNRKLVPVLFEGSTEDDIPTPLRSFTYYRLTEDYEDFYRRLSNQPRVVPPPIGEIKPLSDPPSNREGNGPMLRPSHVRDIRSLYMSTVNKWAELSELDNWESWASGPLWATPGMSRDAVRRLDDVADWLFVRVWPRVCPELESAFDEFRMIARDLTRSIYDFHESDREEEMLWVSRLDKKLERWDPVEHDRLFCIYEFRAGFVADLALELTRAANQICSITRLYVDPAFRIEEGRLSVLSGPHEDLRWSRHIPEYKIGERYEGRTVFRYARLNRDIYMGGENITELRTRESERIWIEECVRAMNSELSNVDLSKMQSIEFTITITKDGEIRRVHINHSFDTFMHDSEMLTDLIRSMRLPAPTDNYLDLFSEDSRKVSYIFYFDGSCIF